MENPDLLGGIMLLGIVVFVIGMIVGWYARGHPPEDE